jgi:hypothetical protein
MQYTLEATDAGFDEENDALTVGFGGAPDTDGYPTEYLMLQRSMDKREDEPGISGVYAEWCEQSMSCYGCIRSFDLYPQSARITFTDGAEFYLPEGMRGADGGERLTELFVTFTIESQEFRDLQEKLSFIFRGCDCYTVHDVDAPTSA